MEIPDNIAQHHDKPSWPTQTTGLIYTIIDHQTYRPLQFAKGDNNKSTEKQRAAKNLRVGAKSLAWPPHKTTRSE